MSVHFNKPKKRWEFSFNRVIAGKGRYRATKLLPKGWSRSQAEAYDQEETARLYALATGTLHQRRTIDEAVEIYCREVIPALKGGERQMKEMANCAWAYMGRFIDELPEVVREYTEQATKEDGETPLAPATVRNRMAYVRAACRYAFKYHKFCEHDPAERLVMPVVKNERHVYTDRRNVLRLVRRVKNRDARAAILTAFYSGMRVGEIKKCYTVIDDRIAMMHNGVLHHGNKADESKSDTWHYIKNIVRPMMEASPKMFLNPAWQALVEADIGNGNRFAIMDRDGELAVLNKDTGIEHDGVWFSNTYAWSPELLIPGYKKYTSLGKYSHWVYAGYDGYDASIKELPGQDDEEDVITFNDQDIWEALSSRDTFALADYLIDAPEYVLEFLLADLQFEPYSDVPFSKTEDALHEALMAEDIEYLVRFIGSNFMSARLVAETICQNGELTLKPLEVPDYAG